MICLDLEVESWGRGGVEVWRFEKKMWRFDKKVWRKLRVFTFGYVRVDVWGKFIEIWEWCDGCKDILNYVNFKITNWLVYKKKEINNN